MKGLTAAFCLLIASFVPETARADILIDNVYGITPDADGGIESFDAMLIGDDGRVEQVFKRGDKLPGKVDYHLDGKRRVLMPGIIDSNVRLMGIGFARLAKEAGHDLKSMGTPRPKDRDLALAKAQETLFALGITTVADIGTTIEDWQTYRRAGDHGSLRLRIIAYAAGTDAMALIGGPGPTPWLYADRLRLNGVHLLLDGKLADHAARLKAPYADRPTSRGEANFTEIQLRNLMSRGAIDNFQVSVTAHGDAAVSTVLDAIEELGPTYQGDRRWRIEAADAIDPADVTRLSEFGAFVSVHPGPAISHRDETETRLGADRTAAAHAWRSLAAAGTPLAFGSGTGETEPVHPFKAMAAAISRQDDNGEPFAGWQPQQALSREQAIDAYTRGAARALFADGRLGRIAPGYRADFVMLDNDPTFSNPLDLREMRVLQTWIGGELVYDAMSTKSGTE